MRIHEFSPYCMLFYCSWGEERAWTPHRSCKTRGEGTIHKVLRSSSSKQTTSWEESKATVTFFSSSGKMEQGNMKSYSTTWRNSLVPKLQDHLPLLISSVYRILRMNRHKKCLVSVPGLLLHCNISLVHVIALASWTFEAAVLWTGG